MGGDWSSHTIDGSRTRLRREGMMFIHAEDAKCRNNSWGWQADADDVPAIGDTVLLWYGPPDGHHEDALQGKVTARDWEIDPTHKVDDQVELTVLLDESIPEGCIPSSRAWPCSAYSTRKAALNRDLERIRAGK